LSVRPVRIPAEYTLNCTRPHMFASGVTPEQMNGFHKVIS